MNTSVYKARNICPVRSKQRPDEKPRGRACVMGCIMEVREEAACMCGVQGPLDIQSWTCVASSEGLTSGQALGT